MPSDRAGGCPLAQTLVEGNNRRNFKVLLLERGDDITDWPLSLDNIHDTAAAQKSKCAEVIRSVEGVSVVMGNCIGGATSFNLGVWIEETADWVLNNFGSTFATEEEILDAYKWVRSNFALITGGLYQLFTEWPFTNASSVHIN